VRGLRETRLVAPAAWCGGDEWVEAWSHGGVMEWRQAGEPMREGGEWAEARVGLFIHIRWALNTHPDMKMGLVARGLKECKNWGSYVL